jgi:hypothetical protein
MRAQDLLAGPTVRASTLHARIGAGVVYTELHSLCDHLQNRHAAQRG